MPVNRCLNEISQKNKWERKFDTVKNSNIRKKTQQEKVLSDRMRREGVVKEVMKWRSESTE